jgi:hypothetical protein
VRALMLRPAAVGALAGFALIGYSTFAELHAADASSQSTTKSAVCGTTPKSTALSSATNEATSHDLATALASSSSRLRSASSSAAPSTSASGSPSASPSDSPSATATSSSSSNSSASTSATTTPSPSPSASATPSPSPSSSEPTASPKPSSPKPTSSSPSKKHKKQKKRVTPQLCVRVQSLSSTGEVKAGHDATFVIWVWSTKAKSQAVSVRASTGGGYGGAPAFTVCPQPEHATCALGTLPVGQAAELEARVRVRAAAGVGVHVRISAEATATGARSFKGTASDVVVAASTPIPSSSNLPTGTNLPAIPGTAVSPTDPSDLFPTVSASPTPSTGSQQRPSAKARALVHVADAAATVPLDTRYIGGQLAGLAVLAGAVTIAIARLSLRTPKPQDNSDATPSNH